MRSPRTSEQLAHVLFVCIGNSCRSQMAEGFARLYGRDVMIAESAGLAPAGLISPLTYQSMFEKNIALDGHYPKGLDDLEMDRFDIVANMSGQRLPPNMAQVMLEWPVRDPIGEPISVYRVVAAEIEDLVMRLILQLRSARAR